MILYIQGIFSIHIARSLLEVWNLPAGATFLTFAVIEHTSASLAQPDGHRDIFNVEVRGSREVGSALMNC